MVGFFVKKMNNFIHGYERDHKLLNIYSISPIFGVCIHFRLLSHLQTISYSQKNVTNANQVEKEFWTVNHTGTKSFINTLSRFLA